MKILLLLNPSKRWKPSVEETLVAQIQRAGHEPLLRWVDRAAAHDTERWIQEGLHQGIRRFGVVGGDGTMNRVINVLAHQGALSTAEVGLIPAGSCNDFARVLGLSPRTWSEAVRRLCRVGTALYDLGVVNGQYFLNNAGVGRRYLSPAHRRKTPIETLLEFQPIPLEARWDHSSFKGAFFMLLACNAPYFSGGLHFSEAPDPTDGRLHIYGVPPAWKWQLALRLTAGRWGRPLQHPATFHAETVQFEVRAETSLWPQADGEPPPPRSTTAVTFRIAPEKLRVCR
ncbi:MAG: hypothetical protein HYZ73_01910 [Elusimicrobia bacterium]|nr:hypothetical protein [Elusimicrobiota bacterium]